MGTVGIGIIDGEQRALCRAGETSTPGNALLFDEQFFDSGYRCDLCLEFSQLIAQKFEACLAIVGGDFERIVFAAAGAHGAGDFRHGLYQYGLIQMLVEHFALGAALN